MSSCRDRFKRRQSLPRRDDRVVIRNLLVIDISCLRQILIAAETQDVLKIRSRHLIFGQTVQISCNLLCHRRRKNTGVGSGIRHQLFLVQFLHNSKRLIRTDLKALGTVVLKLRQIV